MQSYHKVHIYVKQVPTEAKVVTVPMSSEPTRASNEGSWYSNAAKVARSGATEVVKHDFCRLVGGFLSKEHCHS